MSIMQPFTKAKLTNLYINPVLYNPVYNYYNYHKFKQTGVINIIYKTPSIFLNGLYFEFPYMQLVEVRKAQESHTFQLVLAVNPDEQVHGNMTIKDLLTKIDAYNSTFFETHAKRLEYRQTGTHKSRAYYRHLSTPGPEDDGSAQPRFKNPLVKKYEYRQFTTPSQVSGKMLITVDIKHIYLYKICELIRANQQLVGHSEPVVMNFCQAVLDFINQEYMDFKMSSFVQQLPAESTNLNIKFWLKANTLETGRNHIHMIWKVCGYQL